MNAITDYCFFYHPVYEKNKEEEQQQSPPTEAVFDGAFIQPSEKQDVTVSWADSQVQNRVDSALWAGINQVYVIGRGSKNYFFISPFKIVSLQSASQGKQRININKIQNIK